MSALLPIDTTDEKPIRRAIVKSIADSPNRAALARQTNTSRGRPQRSKRGIQRRRWIRVDHPDAIRSDQAHAILATYAYEVRLPTLTVVTVLGKAGRQHDYRLDACATALIGHFHDARRRK